LLGTLLAFIPVNNPSTGPIIKPETVTTLPVVEDTVLKPHISTRTPAFKDYKGIVSQLKEWHSEAPELSEVGSYGKSGDGTDIYYIRLTNKKNYEKKPVVLITAAIHGNEPWSTGVTMAYVGNMLASYGEDEEITNILDTRDIYFVPVISPDSYPNYRWVDGVDPNRNFPTRTNPDKESVPPVQALRDFFLKIKARAVISGHTFGRLYIYPWDDQWDVAPHNELFKEIIGQMGNMSSYEVIKGTEMYDRPIYGTATDWFYRQGAFAICVEYGIHQKKPSLEQIQSEFERTFEATLFFIKKATL
jgi:hypothetical protein